MILILFKTIVNMIYEYAFELVIGFETADHFHSPVKSPSFFFSMNLNLRWKRIEITQKIGVILLLAGRNPAGSAFCFDLFQTKAFLVFATPL